MLIEFWIFMIRSKACRIFLSRLTTDPFYLCNIFNISLDTRILWSMISIAMLQDRLSGNLLMIKCTDQNSSLSIREICFIVSWVDINLWAWDRNSAGELDTVKNYQRLKNQLGVVIALWCKCLLQANFLFHFKSTIHPDHGILSSLTALL
jgi:hypothetical protein